MAGKVIPLAMTSDPPAIKRWCETCQRFTRSAMGGFYSDLEICAEHEEEWEDDE